MKRLISAIAVLAIVRAAAAQTAPLPTWTLVRDLRFGGESDSTTGVNKPQGVVVGPQGMLYVLEETSRSVKQFDASGRYLRSFGRKGNGPGELQIVVAFGLLGDTLWTSDGDQYRVTLFPPDGRNPKTFPLRYEPHRPGVRNVGPDSMLRADVPRAMLRGGLAVAQGGLSWRVAANFPSPIVAMRRDGAVADTLAAPVLRTVLRISLTGKNSRGMETEYVWAQPFQPTDHFWVGRPDGNGIVVVEAPPATRAKPPVITVRTFDGAGKPVRTRTYGYQPMPVVRADVDKSIKEAIAMLDAGAGTDQVLRRQLYTPEFHATVTDVRVGRDGSVWLRRELVPNAGTLWNVIDPQGALAARVTVPKGLKVQYADMESVVGIELDQDDVPWIVRYRVVRR